jgi:Prokaryotic Cytochrome C oxidase subunit IV
MKSILISNETLIWLLLVLLTGGSWFLGEQEIQATSNSSATTLISMAMILIGFFKVRLIGLHFMELRNAPWPLRLIFEAWVFIVCIAILILYSNSLPPTFF